MIEAARDPGTNFYFLTNRNAIFFEEREKTTVGSRALIDPFISRSSVQFGSEEKNGKVKIDKKTSILRNQLPSRKKRSGLYSRTKKETNGGFAQDTGMNLLVYLLRG